MSYAIYLRKSRADIEAEIRGEGETLERHRTALLDLARRLDLTVPRIYSEVVSGDTIASRPQMQQLLEDVENGCWEGVLVMDIDRLARGDTIDQGIVAQAFKNAGCKIITPAKTYDPSNEFDEEYFEFGLFMARREYKAINRRIQRGRIASIQEGKYIGSVPPFGYNRVKIQGAKGYTLEPHPEQAPIVQTIFSLFTDGEARPDGTVAKLGTSMISRQLNEWKILSPGGTTWTGTMVRTILQNPTYMGKIRWGYRPYQKKTCAGQTVSVRHKKKPGEYTLVDGLHPPLVSEDTFQLAQELIKQSKGFPLPYDYQLKNPLSGIVFCGLCGHAMVRRYSKRDEQTYLLCTCQSCNNVSSHFDIVEQHLIQSMENWLLQYKIQMETQNPPQPQDTIQLRSKSLNRLQNELRTLQKQQSNLHDLLEQGVYSTDTFLNRSAVLDTKMSETRLAIQQLEEEIANEEIQRLSTEEFIPQFKHILEYYQVSEDVQTKNDLLKEVLEKVTYIKRSGGRWGDPYNFELSIFPRIPKLNHNL